MLTSAHHHHHLSTQEEQGRASPNSIFSFRLIPRIFFEGISIDFVMCDNCSSSEDEFPHEGPVAPTPSYTVTLNSLTNMTVLETKKIEKIVDRDGRKMWKCHFCAMMWSKWNHTKARHHTIGSRDIACYMILPRWKVVFGCFRRPSETLMDITAISHRDQGGSSMCNLRSGEEYETNC